MQGESDAISAMVIAALVVFGSGGAMLVAILWQIIEKMKRED